MKLNLENINEFVMFIGALIFIFFMIQTYGFLGFIIYSGFGFIGIVFWLEVKKKLGLKGGFQGFNEK